MNALDFRAPEGNDELAELAPIVAWAFNDTPESCERWLERTGLDNLRLARSGGRVVGGMAALPMGQWFGGESVSTLCLAGVAVAASARGGGIALGMVGAALRDARNRGLALSTLYPSTVALYRKAQYELAGTFCRTKLRLSACPRLKSECALSEATSEHQPAIERLYARVARERPGYLDRHEYIWSRVREHKDRKTHAVVVHGPSGLEGYAFIAQRGLVDSIHHDLHLTDFVSTTPRASARLLDFLVCHRSTADHASWFGGSGDDRLLALPDKGYKVEVDAHWMLRIVNVERALSARGYPELDRELVLEVQDPLLPENAGSYALAVTGGRGTVTRIARGSGVRLDVRALAALYTGFLSVNELARAGAVEGDARSLATLGLFFTSTAPALSDYF